MGTVLVQVREGAGSSAPSTVVRSRFVDTSNQGRQLRSLLIFLLFNPTFSARMTPMSATDDLLSAASEKIYEIKTKAPGPAGRLPLTEELLLNSPSGDL